jgi:hypothetical protein
MKWITPLLCAGLAGCSFNPSGGGSIRPLEQLVAVVTVSAAAATVADCIYRQLDAIYSPGVHRTRPASGPDEIIYLGTAGVRTSEMTISPSGSASSTVTFRSIGTIWGNDLSWNRLAPQRAACGF